MKLRLKLKQFEFEFSVPEWLLYMLVTTAMTALL